MPRLLVCPACGEDEELSGRPGPDGIRLTCDKCGASWPRDAATDACATCGGDDLEYRPQPQTDYSRGNQVSIIGWRNVPLCVRCDKAMLEKSLAGRPVANNYRAAALHKRDPGDGSPDQLSIIPR